MNAIVHAVSTSSNSSGSTSSIHMRGASWLALLASVLACSAYATPLTKPVTTLTAVDLPRFMGDWYVIACIPTFIETKAYNAMESYQLKPDGTIATTFTFNKGSFDGPHKRYTPHGFVRDASNARWGMQFVWPIKADYRISYLSADYSQTVIGREARDYVWIMARKSTLSDGDYQRLVEFVTSEGYDIKKLRRVPQRVR